MVVKPLLQPKGHWLKLLIIYETITSYAPYLRIFLPSHPSQGFNFCLNSCTTGSPVIELRDGDSEGAPQRKLRR
jgi:hypothetical protein